MTSLNLNPESNCTYTGIVELNVGGKLFKTRASTLTQNSPYFEALLSKKWNHSRDVEEDQDYPNKIHANDEILKVFIDKDPEPFGYILTYLREGIVDIPGSGSPGSKNTSPIRNYDSLAKCIVLQAQYFGLEDFVNHVKIKAWKLCGHPSVGCLCEDHEALEAFDKKYESLYDAFEQGFLPSAYFGKYDGQFHIQVGNTCFRMSKSTLQSHSEYLKREILASHCKHSIFLDQDPKAFQYLTNYMRYRQLDLPRNDVFLFQRVLHIAVDIEMKDFLVLVKARTMVNIERHMGLDPIVSYDSPFGSSTVIVSDVHVLYAAQFDRRFHNFDRAFSAKMLPDRFFD